MDTGLKPEKPHLFKPLKVKDWKGIIIDFSMAIINGAMAVAGIKTGEDALERWMSIAKDVGWETTEEELLGKLVTRAMWKAIYKLAYESRSSFPPRSDAENKKLEKEIKQYVEKHMLTLEFTIDERFFSHPGQCEFVDDAKAFLRNLLSNITDPYQAAALANRLPSFFVFELHDEWRAKVDTYKPLLDYFSGSPFAKARAAENDWARYSSYLCRQAEESVFGSCFGLSQLYVPLNASYTESLSKRDTRLMPSDIRGDQENQRPIAIELESHLLKWVESNDQNDAIRVISGGPGTGKSSFAKIFAAKLAEKNLHALFIPLHKIDVSGNIVDAVGDYLMTEFTENPLRDQTANMLVIFDGLDELTETGRKYAEVAKDFVDRADKQLVQPNRNSRCVRVLYTGRVIVVQSVQSLFDKSQVLSLLPYHLTKNERMNYIDENHLLSEDKRDLWWKKYGELTGQTHSCVPEGFCEGRLAELTAQPLLNYMVAITPEVRDGMAQAINVNEIYERLLERIYRRDWEDRRQLRCLKELEESDYPLIFETIAVAAWHGAGRTVSVAEINTLIQESENVIKWEDFQNEEATGVYNMLTAFYFHQIEREGDRRYEFTHKSFREYLTAQSIVRTLEDMRDKFKEQEEKPKKQLHPTENALNSWRKLCAPTGVDNDLYQFLKDEMEIRNIRASKTVMEWQEMLCNLIGYVATEGLPSTETRPSLLEELRMCQNAEIALLAAHSACAWATGKCSVVDWGKEPTAANIWLKRLGASQDDMILKRCLNHIRWQDQSFDGYSLRGADLAGSEIYGHTIYPKAIGEIDMKDLWWIVLEEDLVNSRVLLLSLVCVTFREYHHEDVKITWEKCSLREWLNGAFLKSALYSVRESILPITVYTNENPFYNTDGGSYVEDMIFLLSINEVEKYFGATTCYEPNDSLMARLNGEAVWWWLRSPGCNSIRAALVGSYGFVIDAGFHVSLADGAVRPAFWLNLQS